MGLAPTTADFIFERLIEIRRQIKLTILLVEQRVAEALESADHGYVLEAGRVALEGNKQTLRGGRPRPARPISACEKHRMYEQVREEEYSGDKHRRRRRRRW